METDPRVLVVEDDGTVRRMLGRMLKLNHYQVKEASDFEAALLVLDQDPLFDVILLDVNFPGGGGLKLLPHLVERCSRATVIVVSALEDAEVMFELLAGGAADFVPKPFDVTVLMERIKNHLGHKQAS